MGYDKDYANGESIVFRCGRDPGEKAAPEVVRKFARKRDLIAEEKCRHHPEKERRIGRKKMGVGDKASAGGEKEGNDPSGDQAITA